MPRLILPLVLLALTASAPAAQESTCPPGYAVPIDPDDPGGRPLADGDYDCVPSLWEDTGWSVDTRSKKIVQCTPGTEGCLITDPSAWSTDGDPYSDLQEVLGNVPSSVRAPYDHPHVAAMPTIEVFLVGYTFTPLETITFTTGGGYQKGQSSSTTTTETDGWSYTVGGEAGLDQGKPTLKASGSYSETHSTSTAVTTSTSSSSYRDWGTARTFDPAEAATLSLSLRLRNRGGAPVQNVRPTFNLYVGGELVTTVRPGQNLASRLAPSLDLSPVVTVDGTVDAGGAPQPITLTLDQLRRLQTGAPVEIRVVSIASDVERWNVDGEGWTCDNTLGGSTCPWGPFAGEVEERTSRMLVDFGYSGDPDRDPPRGFTLSPYSYYVYAGRTTDRPDAPGYTLREMLEVVGLADGGGGGFALRGRPYPDLWHAASGPETDFRGDQFYDHWEDYAETAGDGLGALLDMPMPPSVSVVLASPAHEPGVAGPVVASAVLGADMRTVEVVATPKGSLAIESARAHLYVHGEEVVVDLERAVQRDRAGQPVLDPETGEPIATNTFVLPEATALPVSAGESSHVVFRDISGAERVAALEPTLPAVSDCRDLPGGVFSRANMHDYFVYSFTKDRQFARGNTVVFVDGDEGRQPASVTCAGAGAESVTHYWYQLGFYGQDTGFNDVAVLDTARVVGVGYRETTEPYFDGAPIRLLTRDESRGTFFYHQWEEPELPADLPEDVVLRAVAFREGGAAGAEVGVAVGDGVVLRTDDGGLSWIRAGGAVDAPFRDVDHAGGGTWYAVGGTVVHRSTNDGRTWEAVSVSVPGRPDFASLSEVEFISATDGVIGDPRMADTRGRIYATRDGGQTWQETFPVDGIKDIVYNGRDGWAVLQTNRAGDRILFAETLLDPVNADANPFSFALRESGLDLQAAAFGTPEIGFALASDGRVWRTDKGGRSWDETPGYPIRPPYTDAPTQRGTSIAMLGPNIGVVAGVGGMLGITDSGGGFPTYTTDGNPVDAEDAPTPAPERDVVALRPPAPNPLRTSARVRYTLGAPGPVRLAVYDALGREVAVLAEGERPAGDHEAALDARRLAAGVYVVRLVGGGAAATRTVTVVR